MLRFSCGLLYVWFRFGFVVVWLLAGFASVLVGCLGLVVLIVVWLVVCWLQAVPEFGFSDFVLGFTVGWLLCWRRWVV